MFDELQGRIVAVHASRFEKVKPPNNTLPKKRRKKIDRKREVEKKGNEMRRQHAVFIFWIAIIPSGYAAGRGRRCLLNWNPSRNHFMQERLAQRMERKLIRGVMLACSLVHCRGLWLVRVNVSCMICGSAAIRNVAKSKNFMFRIEIATTDNSKAASSAF